MTVNLRFASFSLSILSRLYINGKFLGQRTTGVQRFARGVVSALDRSLTTRPVDHEVELLMPPEAVAIEGLTTIRQREVGRAGRPLTLWEQWDLPGHARDGTLLCLSGSAPFFARNCIPTIHDAAVYLYPQAYSRAFVMWYRWLFAYRAARSPMILTVSDSSARDLAKPLPRAQFRIVPNSAEHITRSAAEIAVLAGLKVKDRSFLLAVGSLNPTKNFATLVAAYVDSPLAERLPLVIVGAVNREVFRSTAPMADHPNVRWAGPVSDAQLRALYEAATVFVFPSLYEGFGIPPLEAMHCGCPVVASHASSIPEVCGDAALYFDPQDGAAMTRAISTLLEQPERRQALILLGHARAQSFSWDYAAAKLRAALAEFQFIAR